MKARRFMLALGLAISLSAIAPAHAANTLTGAVALVGNAHLNSFPCSGCSGTFSGVLSGSIAGVTNNVPWSVVNFQAPFTATFSYNDSCTQVGLADGGGTINTYLGATIGTYGPVLGVVQLPEPVTELQIPFTFSWARAGLAAVLTPINFSQINLRVVEPGGILSWKTVGTNVSAAGVAGFVPLNVPSCPTGSSPLDAEVVGSLAVLPNA